MKKTGSQSIERALDLLYMVAEKGNHGVTVAGLVERSGLTRPTVHRLLSALVRANLVERGAGRDLYFLGAGCCALGMIAESRQGMHALAHESVLRLADQSGDTAFFSVRRGASSLCLIREEGKFPIRSHILDVGQVYPLGVAAHGISLLAALSDEEADAVIHENAEAYAERYPTLTREILWSLIDETRDLGWSLNRGLFHENAWAMGVVVKGFDGQVIGAVSIGSMKDRFDPDRRPYLADMLQQEAVRISKKMEELIDRSSPGAKLKSLRID